MWYYFFHLNPFSTLIADYLHSRTMMSWQSPFAVLSAPLCFRLPKQCKNTYTCAVTRRNSVRIAEDSFDERSLLITMKIIVLILMKSLMTRRLHTNNQNLYRHTHHWNYRQKELLLRTTTRKQSTGPQTTSCFVLRPEISRLNRSKRVGCVRSIVLQYLGVGIVCPDCREEYCMDERDTHRVSIDLDIISFFSSALLSTFVV